MGLSIGIVGLPNVGPSFALTVLGSISSTNSVGFGGLHLLKLTK